MSRQLSSRKISWYSVPKTGGNHYASFLVKKFQKFPSRGQTIKMHFMKHFLQNELIQNKWFFHMWLYFYQIRSKKELSINKILVMMSFLVALFDKALLLLRFIAEVAVILVTCWDTVGVIDVVPCTVWDAEVVGTFVALLVVASVDVGVREDTVEKAVWTAWVLDVVVCKVVKIDAISSVRVWSFSIFSKQKITFKRVNRGDGWLYQINRRNIHR